MASDSCLIDLINEAIKENLGINSEMDAEASRATKSIISNIGGKTAMIKDGIPQVEHSEKATVAGKSLTFHVTEYFFDSEPEKDKWAASHVVLTGWIEKLRWICIPIFVIGGKPPEDLFDTVYHEIEHAFQTTKMGHDFGSSKQYMMSISNLSNENEAERTVAEIVYSISRAEQDALVNGMYGQLKNTSNIITLDDDFKNSEAYLWLGKLHDGISAVEKSNDYDTVISRYGWNRNTFLNRAKKSEREFINKITRVLYKLKTEVLEGYRAHVSSKSLVDEDYLYKISY